MNNNKRNTHLTKNSFARCVGISNVLEKELFEQYPISKNDAQIRT